MRHRRLDAPYKSSLTYKNIGDNNVGSALAGLFVLYRTIRNSGPYYFGGRLVNVLIFSETEFQDFTLPEMLTLYGLRAHARYWSADGGSESGFDYVLPYLYPVLEAANPLPA